MPTSYPGALDSFVNPASTDTQDDPPHHQQHADANDAVEAVQAELGINPRGAFATVRGRLDFLNSTRVIVRAAGVTTAVETTETDLVEATIVIPVGWNTFDIDVIWALRLVDSSGGNTGISTAVTFQLDLDGIIIPGTQSTEVTDLNTADALALAGIGWAEGQSTTGSRVLTLIASRGGAPTINALGIRMRVEATRLT